MAIRTLGSLQKAVDKVAERLAGDYVYNPPRFDQRKIIRDAVHGFFVLDPEMLLLVDSPFVQRLRGLSQTALARLTYPSATHTRFEHSVGVYHMTCEMIDAYERNPAGGKIPTGLKSELKIAALLHDTGHGPFSHASEDVYGRMELFTRIKNRNKKQFANAHPSEILTWCLLRSRAFRILWNHLKRRAPNSGLDDKSLIRIGSMIVGSDVGLDDETRHLRTIVNGPFDADKLDYLQRDGHFTGLRILLDVERLLWGLRVAPNPDNGRRELCIDVGSLSALEQVIFCKAQLFGQLYHHHKVRAAAALITRMLERFEKLSPALASNPAKYLTFDEASILGASWKDATMNTLVRRITRRKLPMRCLVMSKQTLYTPPAEDLGDKEGEEPNANETNWNQKVLLDWRTDRKSVLTASRQIAARARQPNGSVIVDAPPPASLLGPGGALIFLAGTKTMWLHDLFPAEGWANTYNAYRASAYIFSDARESAKRMAIAEAGREWLSDKGVRFTDLAVDLARIPSP